LAKSYIAQAQAWRARAEHRLTLVEMVDWLVLDGLVATETADQLKKDRRYYKGSAHPLVIIADQKWKSAKPPHRALSLEALTEWMAQRVGIEYVHIDPLKIDFSAVTEVMSSLRGALQGPAGRGDHTRGGDRHLPNRMFADGKANCGRCCASTSGA
jgi:hypothetical protein